jgi:hypothetical protein
LSFDFTLNGMFDSVKLLVVYTKPLQKPFGSEVTDEIAMFRIFRGLTVCCVVGVAGPKVELLVDPLESSAGSSA